MGKGIIHNNISTHTILLTKDMVVKISNFEYAVKIHEDVNKATCYSSDLFSLGEVISTILGLKYSGTLTADKENIKELMVSMFEICQPASQPAVRPTSQGAWAQFFLTMQNIDALPQNCCSD